MTARTKTMLLTAALACGLGTAAHAQLGGGGDVVIEADTLDVHNADGVAIYQGAVNAVQGDSQLRADRLELYFDQNRNSQEDQAAAAFGNINHAIATGNVYYVTPEQVANGDRAVYDVASDSVTMTGNVVVKQGCDVLVGDEMVMNMTTHDAQVRAGGEPVSGRPPRVRTVIRSKSGDQGGDAVQAQDCAS